MQNINLITQNDLCISCGACKHACPAQVINIEMNQAKGFYEPIIVNEGACSTCEARPCLTVCPSYEEDFVKLAQWADPEQTIGPWHAIYTGYSTSETTRQRSSSGGIIKELCRYYLETGHVDAVITLRHMGGLEYEPDIYTDIDDVLQTPGSIYHNIKFDRAIEILKTTPGKFLLIAIPCQLTSIHKWLEVFHDQCVGTVAATVGLICGWMYTRDALRYFARSQGIDYDDLQDATYRGGDKFGNLVLKTSQETYKFNRRPVYGRDRHTIPYWVAFSRPYNSQRCLLCVEHVNYLADIVVGDAWLAALKQETMGTSIIIVRNPQAQTALEELVNRGRLQLFPSTEADVIESQSKDLALGISAQKIINKMAARGQFHPQYILPRPQHGMPSVTVWSKNYLIPRLIRYLIKHGHGYAGYRGRFIFYHAGYWTKFLLARFKTLYQRPARKEG